MQPDDLSLPRADNKIKEKLNLHVKKRLLQDPGKCTPSSSKIPPQSITCPVVVSPSASVAPPPPTPKTKKQKTKHSPAAATNTSAASGQSVQLTIGTLGSLSSRPAEGLLLSPGAGATGGNSNDSSFNSVEADPDASNDGQAGTSGGDKAAGSKASSSKPDIFTLILNEKKASLMRDPEHLCFFEHRAAVTCKTSNPCSKISTRALFTFSIEEK
ncbi:uncharacterized protein LOC120412785 isoform X1 [Culex pipiens pallens]|uniref:uncharacterized protein LOC120412785 isoform X1 n=1 Tax=Culex pipiens pallens TaxID=42434 RepID=UPI001954DCA1|nr:uncharacterized protein LOC120412785 isoform X1 [Culex pipiens pallens]